MTVAGYMYIGECEKKEKIIEEQKEENLQVYYENKDLRAEKEDLKEDKIYLEKKLKVVESIANDYDKADCKVAKIKEVIQGSNLK